MKISEAWLREWATPSLTGEQLVAQLTMAGLEVDARHAVAGEFSHVVVAEVIATAVHPQADRLTLCEVNAGSHGVKKVVCGASNVRPHLRVALALPGAALPGDILIKETKLRGELSQGMLCSGTELGMDDRSEGIIELAADAPIGADLREYMALNDFIIDVDLTPNRADCFSILGVSREVAALNNLPLKALPSDRTTPHMDEAMPIQVLAAQACPQYCGRIIRGIDPHAVTPLWLKERLRRSGIRTVHPVVDVTNYVMLELGQPMHAFDLNAINGGVEVRFSKTSEKITLLDGQEVTLDDNVLIIADKTQPLAMAGVMGGAGSAVQTDTVDLFLESAFFNPLTIAGVARRYGLSSDSSQRFERGVDPSIQQLALERATSLLTAIVGGEVGPISAVVHNEDLPAANCVVFNPEKVRQLTGIDVERTTMAAMLTRLGMKIDQQASHWLVSIPSHRFDIALDVDLVEEVVRVYGYDNLEAAPLVTTMQASVINPLVDLSRVASAHLKARGYNETISYSFVDPQLQEALYPDVETMQLLNPISSELSQMRVGMWPGLLASMIYNVHRQQTAVQFFETGVVFDVQGSALQERLCIAGLLSGQHGHFNWSETKRSFDFYDMKGDLQSLFQSLNNPTVQFQAAEHPALHPGQSAKIMINGLAAGWIGVLHPRLLDALDLTGEVMLFEITLATLANATATRYQTISKYPQTRRDLSFLVDDHVSASHIEQVVRSVATEKLKTFDVFDVYHGGSIPAGKKSLGFTLTLQNDTRTLVDAEINEIIDAIIKKLEEECAITLRMEAL